MAVTETIDKRIKEIQNDLHNIDVLIQRKAELEQELAGLEADRVRYNNLLTTEIEYNKLTAKPVII